MRGLTAKFMSCFKKILTMKGISWGCYKPQMAVLGLAVKSVSTLIFATVAQAGFITFTVICMRVEVGYLCIHPYPYLQFQI